MQLVDIHQWRYQNSRAGKFSSTEYGTIPYAHSITHRKYKHFRILHYIVRQKGGDLFADPIGV